LEANAVKNKISKIELLINKSLKKYKEINFDSITEKPKEFNYFQANITICGIPSVIINDNNHIFLNIKRKNKTLIDFIAIVEFHYFKKGSLFSAAEFNKNLFKMNAEEQIIMLLDFAVSKIQIARDELESNNFDIDYKFFLNKRMRVIIAS
jgi:hypothetical protein